MAYVKANEPLPERAAIIMLHGPQGVAKTSIAHTCKKPLLVDFDRGVDRSHGRKDVIVPDDWNEILKYEREGFFRGFDTLIIDTPKTALDDFLVPYVIQQDYKLSQPKYTMQRYGAIGDEFKRFVSMRRQEGIDILFIAHSKKDEDTKKFIPDITGQSLTLLLRAADQISFITIENGQRVIYSEPSDAYEGKNTGKFPKITVPGIESPAFKTFCADMFVTVRTELHAMSEEQREALEQSEKYQGEIENATEPDALTLLMPIMDELPEYLKAPLRKLTRDKCATMGWEWDKANSCFKSKAPADPAQATTPPDQDPPPPVNPPADTSTDPKSLLFDEVKSVLADKPGYDAKNFKKVYKLPAELELVLTTAIDLKDIANLYSKNAELLGQHPETKEKVDAKRTELESLIQTAAA